MAVIRKDTLHPTGQPDVDVYPNIVADNIPVDAVDSSKLSPAVRNSLNGKLDKNTTVTPKACAYIKSPSGASDILPISEDVTASTLVKRNSKGEIHVNAPTESSSAVNLQYFNEHLPASLNLYCHTMMLKAEGVCICFEEYNNSAVQYTETTLFSSHRYVMVSGVYTAYGIVHHIEIDPDNERIIIYSCIDGDDNVAQIDRSEITSFEDHVRSV